MKNFAFALVFLSASTLPLAAARSQDANANPTADPKLTISQVVNAGNALKQLAPFKFSGATLFKMAEMLDQAEKVQKTYTDAFNALLKQTYGSMEVYSTLQIKMSAEAKKIDAGQMEPGDRTPDPKREAFTAEAEKMFAGPAVFSVQKLTRDELCLVEAPPACSQANAIPIDVLKSLLPVIAK